MGRVRGIDWMKEHVADRYVKRARAEGLRSRAAYKLDEIAVRDRLLGPGMLVVDLGAAPGSWSQIAAERVGERGRVIAVDKLEMRAIPGVTFIRGDFRDVSVMGAVECALDNSRVDLVLSDMGPNLSGIATVDQARALELAELARDFALKHLKLQGNLLLKTFHGAGYEGFLKDLRKRFHAVTTRKPAASRSRSSEVYVLAKGLKSEAEAGPAPAALQPK
jgi:23S rRNA (uridine2552-2'-O)-methyltransferase